MESHARLLAAWISDREARALLPGMDVAGIRAVLARRPAGVDQSDLIRPLPASMGEYVARLRDSPQAAECLAEGFVPALADLSRVCAFRPSVGVAGLHERAAGVRTGDIGSLAEFTLPLGPPADLTLQFDHDRLTFVTNPVSQPVHVVGGYSGPAENGPPGTLSVGFLIRAATSLVQVASVRGRYFLRDGYHRCLGLLRRGVRYVPALVCDDMPLADVVPPGTLPFETVMGDRPPVLPDYWDDNLARSYRCAATRRIVVIRASELAVDD
jgi:hypothetical protein